ncbi:HNH endonuclease [Bacillus sp. RG28]|uniref:Putative HNH nuclease YajD n=1 Tax=Gottfriedia endophytica TaxID=2820819 RepID=A0A940NRJ1_9BACI|nr:HNH endonuclease signature motif containing protein [Gottfriedia endophytica]MBP0725546.1 HNH endonuclease [Gottfriedia endophytica]
MPSKPMKPCRKLGCINLTNEGFCEEHKQLNKQHDNERGNANKRGYNYRWQKARLSFLQKNPLCVRCLNENKYTSATVVDHIKPHKGDMNLFWDKKNWQPLCKHHHDVKTVTEDGGFGNR